jgi:O-antigen biosynthesis protein WbqV
MGASKRLCEKYIQNFSSSSNSTKFSIVRFGNVLGSTGSVVPLFQEQIKQGGPITITDPKVSRYFMTIREAVELVLISSQLETKNGEIFILEMGKPFFIKDLAKRMINLLGEKEDEIKIIYTGLRKGEKLSEQLFFNKERITNTNVKGIVSTTDKIYNVDTSDYNSLVLYIQKNETKKAIDKFKKMLPEYKVDVKN